MSAALVEIETGVHHCMATTKALDGVTQIERALERLDVWIEHEEFRGWDPHDALNSPLLRVIAGDNRLMGMIFVQFMRRTPINLRRLLGVPKTHNPKAMGLFLGTYSQKFASTRSMAYKNKIRVFSDWLIEHAASGYAGPCWGYHFDWPNRAFFAPAGTPTIVNTAFIALSFLDAHDAVNLPQESEPSAKVQGDLTARSSGNVDGLTIARNACEFILRDLNVYRSSDDEACFSYTPRDRRFVHNANVLGAWLLAAVSVRTGEARLADGARAAARFTVTRQTSDGSWPYGIDKRDQWVDNLHTGYVLVATKRVGRLLDIDEFDASVVKGYQFWKQRMFLENSAPKYYPNRTYPIDVHCVAQAILTYLEFSDIDPNALHEAEKLCRWAIANLQDPKGFFHYQIHRRHRVRVPYMRWGQAWMQLALTKLLSGVCALRRQPWCER